VPPDEPAHRARRHAHEHHSCPPCLVHRRIDLVQAPEGEQVGDAATGHPHDVLGEQVLGDVGDVRLGEQRQVADPPAGPPEGGVHREQGLGCVTCAVPTMQTRGLSPDIGQSGGEWVCRPEPPVQGAVAPS